ncbi:DNA replication and repair protein RadC [Anaerobranca californiensis DSM 14826]|jgi:DNA repair protein RadC|uniref:DNA replication and repair protein RadC n=1 Tax=Anaerobranca californiensis DSM 14826 TaxID=1120989 RepID=A0A1M6NJB7_9FIRM|nr:DNA repair protein RadC [Anaerobranca californiensis]SHJ95780.1 DNA replication and repair protein RadC [Anaerobranca californiensis DSM 14826]
MKKFKDLPITEKPREKLVRFGTENLSDSELLAILLRTGTKDKTVLQLAQEIIREFGLKGLAQMDIADLKEIPGIGLAKATEIKAVFEIAARIQGKSISSKRQITCPKDVVEIMINKLQYLNQEHFYIVLLNTKNVIISYEEVSKGGLNIASIYPREVFNKAIKNSAARIILVHNHPSGDPTPSLEDINLTKRLIEVGKLTGIKVLDHIIVGQEDYISLKEEGYFDD